MPDKKRKKKSASKARGAVDPFADQSGAAALIDSRIADLGDWRGDALARVRTLIREALPDVVEEVKWRKPSNRMLGVPVWSRDGIICTGETYKDKVKLTFAKGAGVEDPAGLFNASLEGSVRRAIDLHEGERLNARAFKALVKRAAALNADEANAKGERAKKSTRATKKKGAGAKPRLLSGGNPQIPKGDGDGPVQAYIKAMPGWKRDVGRRLDEIIVRNAPGVRKAVRWNSPFYGVEGRGWFLSFHCMTKYIKVAFLNGSSLDPKPPVESKHAQVRYLHIHEGEEIDAGLVGAWVRQGAEVEGDRCF